MKAKNLFFGALACLAFAACSNDDDAVKNPSAEGDGKYIAVNIVNPVTTRADGMEYEDGVAEETQVDDVLLLFFNNNKLLQVVDATITDKQGTEGEDKETVDDDWTGTVTDKTIEKISSAVAYIVPTETGGEPNGVLAILNAKAHNINATNLENKTLAQVRALLQNYVKKTDGAYTDFIMSNTVWKENSTGIQAITSDNFKSSKEDAQNAPVDIYVERVLAKVTVEMSDAFQNNGPAVEEGEEAQPYQIVGADGTVTEKYIKPYLLGVHLAAQPTQSTLVKWVNPSWTFSGWTWSEAALKRSYWAKMHEDIKEVDYSRYDERSNGFENVTFYCHENTANGSTSALTELVVLAQLKEVSAYTEQVTAESQNAASIVYLNGIYYTEEGFINKMASILEEKFDFSPVTDGNQEWNWAEKIEIVKKRFIGATDIANGITLSDTYKNAKQWEIVAQLKKEVTDLGGLSQAEGNTDWNVNASNINTKLADYTGWLWDDGKAYYHVVIKHDGTQDAYYSEDATKGIVRNHVYKLTLSSVVGLGSPVYDPDGYTPDPENPSEPEEPIIPETPEETTTYIGARINVLQWRVVEQNVDLGK